MGWYGGGGGRGGGFGPLGGRFSREEEEKLERKVSDIVLFKKLMRYFAPYKRRIMMLIGLMLGSSLIGLITPLVTKIVLDSLILPGMITGEKSTLNLWLLGMVAIVVAQFGLGYSREYLIAWVGSKIVYDLRRDMTSKLQTMSTRYFAEGETGRIMSRVTNDVEEMSHFLGLHFVTVVSDVIIVIGTLFLMFTFSPELTLISLAVMPLMLIPPFFMRRYMRKAWRQTRVKFAGMTSFLQENVSGMRVVQAFSQESRDSDAFNVANLETVRARLRATLVTGIFGIGVGLTEVTGTVALLWYGSILMVNGNVTIGTFVAFQSMIQNFWRPLIFIANFYSDFQNAMASTERIFELLDTEEEIKEAPESERQEMEKVQGEIKYDHITFGYDLENPVLKDVNLVISPNEKVALVGPTGAGKTTMINLLCRFYDPQKGTITLDGKDIKRISLRSLRRHMGIVLQDTFLFQGTVKENIKYGRPEATDEEVMEAAKAVNAHEFILRLPEGYDTVIREGSTNISMGQRQLITFARALLVDPKILILDEATSSVDPYTELIIQKGLEKLLENRTSIIIAHRLSTVRNADKIVVIDNGEIVEMGRHKELLEKGGLYNRLYMRQFRDETEEKGEAPMQPQKDAGRMMGMREMGGATADTRFAALRGKMMEFRRLLQEKEVEGYNVDEFKELGKRLFETLRRGEVVSKDLDEAIERLKNLKH